MLFATIIYAMQLAFVRAIFVNKLHNHWEMMIEFIKIKNQDSADISLSYRFFGLACWGASIFIYLFSLLVLIAISIYISFDKSSYLIASMFGFLAIMAAVLSWSRKATSMPDMEKIKRIVFSKSLDRLISRFDRVGIAGAILSLVIALHALGSFFFCDLDRLSFELNDACCIKEIQKELSHITYFHSFAMMSGVLYVYSTHYIMSSVNTESLNLAFRLIAAGALIFYGSVQTVILIATHLPIYVYVYMIGPGGDLPIQEVIVTLTPAMVGVVGGFLSGLPGRK